MKRFKKIARTLNREIKVYQSVLQDKRTPLCGKIFLGLAVVYLFLPFDLIPDFIHVLCHVDDAIIVPALIIIALWFIPTSVIEEHRMKLGELTQKSGAS
jgi:uncharacterized membrane protein YkvA (DUF1232 family)